jgi:hypothetical protein
MLTAGGERLKIARPSFLKKRSKKLLRLVTRMAWKNARCGRSGHKSFLVLFFKKELFLEGLSAPQEERPQ